MLGPPLHVVFVLDINECAASQCDVASTECANTPGSFHCKCRKGFAPTLECRPVGDLGMINGGIPDESITVSSSEGGYDKSVSIKIFSCNVVSKSFCL